MNEHNPGLTLVYRWAGFIGSNLAASYLSRGFNVRVLDNLSRPGTEKNLAWLQALSSDRLEVVLADVRDEAEVSRAAAGVDLIVHLASQVAVTSSVVNPRLDFQVNALGTINVLEAARASSRRPIVLLASTNKVYGGMEDLVVERTESGYGFRDLPMGVSEIDPSISTPLRLLEGVRGFLRAGLRANLRSPHSCLPAVLHLWSSPVRQ